MLQCMCSSKSFSFYRYEYPVKVYHASDSAAESEMLLSNHKANQHEEVEDSEVESDEPGKE